METLKYIFETEDYRKARIVCKKFLDEKRTKSIDDILKLSCKLSEFDLSKTEKKRLLLEMECYYKFGM